MTTSKATTSTEGRDLILVGWPMCAEQLAALVDRI